MTTMAAYAFSRLRFAGRITMLKAILLIQVFPNLLALVAIYVIIFQTGQIIPCPRVEYPPGLIMVYLGGSMGMNIWLMKGFLDTIPRAIDESGMVDGASLPDFLESVAAALAPDFGCYRHPGLYRHLRRLHPGPHPAHRRQSTP
jgi:ABC-type maltose transport system permease subunit